MQALNRRVTASICAAFLTAFVTQGFAAAQQAKSTMPNVIVAMTYDQGFGDLSLHGNPVLRTSHLDTLAADSVQAKPFYVHRVCTSTRASLFTGRYP